MAEPIARVDRWSFTAAIVSTALVAVILVVGQLPGSVSFYLVPLSAFAFVVASITVLAMALDSWVKGRSRRAGSILLVVVLPTVLFVPMRRAAELVHLALTVGLGVGQIGVSSNADHSFVVYDWSTGFAGSNTFLIRDVTDEIALPAVQNTHPLNSENDWEAECAGKVNRLLGHYYLCYI